MQIRALLMPHVSQEALAGMLDYFQPEPRREIVAELDPSFLASVLDQADPDVGRAVLHACCGGDPARLRDFEVRFSGVVFPGEIVTDIWRESSNRVVIQARTAERGEVTISNAAAAIA